MKSRSNSASFDTAIARLTLWQVRVEAPYQPKPRARKVQPIIRLVRLGYEDKSFRLGLFLDHEPIGEPTFVMLAGTVAEEMKAEMIALGQRLAAKMAHLYRQEFAPLSPVSASGRSRL